MKTSSWVLLMLGLILLIIAMTQIFMAAQDLEIIQLPESSPPTTIIAPKIVEGEARPVVLIGHGFAGSSLLMRGFSFTLAKAGYTVVAWDFDGHGRNPSPFPQAQATDPLVENARSALEEARAFDPGKHDQVAILGHSMGSGVALTYGIEYPDTAATIAISPIPVSVSPDSPHNLLLMAGELEPRFVANAEQLLTEAGGPGGDPSVGTARALRVISGVEHISILFDPESHAEARAWLDGTFGSQPGAAEYTDRRMRWYGIGMLGMLMLGWAITPLLNEATPTMQIDRPLWRRFLAPISGVLAATILLWCLDQLGIRTDAFLGLDVGGYVLLWLGLAGSISLALLGLRLPPFSLHLLRNGLLAFIVLWLGVGLLANFVWTPWLLIPKRLILWPVGALLSMPWFIAIGEALRGEGFLRRLVAWIGHSLLLAGGFVLSLQLIPGLYVLILVLPLLPVILGQVELATARLRGNWPFAISGALFLSWTLLAVFPML